MPERVFIYNVVHKSEWTSLMRNGMMEIIFPFGRKYYTQIGISIKGNKIKEKAKDLTWLTDTWGFE